MELYHLHEVGKHSELWQEGNVINVDDTYQSSVGALVKGFGIGTKTDKFPHTTEVYNSFLTDNNYDPVYEKANIDELFLFAGISNPVEERRLLKIMQNLLKKADKFSKEIALETFRKEYFPHLPSRLNSMFLTTNDGVAYWKARMYDKSLEVYEVECDEEPFLTNDQAIMHGVYTYDDYYQLAHNYWEPNNTLENAYSAEYLARGKVRVRRKELEL